MDAVGTSGTVLGYPDAKNRKVLLKVLLTFPGASTPSEVLHEVYPRNIMLTSDFEEQNNAPGSSSGIQDDDGDSKDKGSQENGPSRTGCS